MAIIAKKILVCKREKKKELSTDVQLKKAKKN